MNRILKLFSVNHSKIRGNKPVDAITSGLKCNEGTGYFHSLKVSSQKLLVNHKKKNFEL